MNFFDGLNLKSEAIPVIFWYLLGMGIAKLFILLAIAAFFTIVWKFVAKLIADNELFFVANGKAAFHLRSDKIVLMVVLAVLMSATFYFTASKLWVGSVHGLYDGRTTAEKQLALHSANKVFLSQEQVKAYECAVSDSQFTHNLFKGILLVGYWLVIVYLRSQFATRVLHVSSKIPLTRLLGQIAIPLGIFCLAIIGATVGFIVCFWLY